ncbi:MAG: hypothetical protein PHW50_01315 [Patescibacteria group bacterium]|nr:hypothetical protein [Patescibacteria group bacterium]
MIKKIIFYVSLVLILIFFQLYTTPFFFIWALPILFWLELGSKEVFIFLITAIFLDLLSSFYFGFWLGLSISVFFFSGLILQQYLREWTLWAFVLVFAFWQIIYGFLYLVLSKTPFTWDLLLDFLWSVVFCIIIFMALEYLKKFLIDQNIVSINPDKEYKIL